MRPYIIEGPAGVGNVLGFYHDNLVPAGRFAVVRDGEYANGGAGPCLCTSRTFASRTDAESALRLVERSDAEAAAE